jgi:hypothetical protein
MRVSRKNFIAYMLIWALLGSVFMPAALAQSGRVVEQWREPGGTPHPGYVQQLANGNLLVCRNGYQDPGVREMTPEGKTVWEYKPVQAYSARRLADGNTLITDSGAPGPPFKPRVLEISTDGKIVWEYVFPTRAAAPRYAERTARGTTLVTVPTGILELDRNKNKVWQYTTELVNPVYATLLADEHYLVVDRGMCGGGKVIELDASGRVVWRYGNGVYGTGYNQLKGPVAAVRTPDGNTVIADLDSARLLEVTPGKAVVRVSGWEEVLTSEGVSNQWHAFPLETGEFLLAVNDQKGSGILHINDASIKTYLDGDWLYTEVLPFFRNGRVMVPLRELFQGLGAQVSWNKENQSITATRNDRSLTLTVGSTKAVVNGTETTLDVAPCLKSGLTFVPLRLVGEALGAQVVWEDAARTIKIASSLPN